MLYYRELTVRSLVASSSVIQSYLAYGVAFLCILIYFFHQNVQRIRLGGQVAGKMPHSTVRYSKQTPASTLCQHVTPT